MRTTHSTSRRPFAAIRRAFSLIEALVAVAAIAVIGAALATVFQSVGDTVTGGREISRFNALADRVEQQMRADIDRMSRDGFLLMRHVAVGATRSNPLGLADAPNRRGIDPVFLDPEDPSPRARRADELLFFARGQFSTARSPISDTLPPATGSAARIYYGHGVRLPEEQRYPRTVDGEDTQQFDLIDVDDARAIDGWNPPGGNLRGFSELRLGGSLAAGTQTLGERGPNEFAADWTLLRHAAVLVEPTSSSGSPADNGGTIIIQGRERRLNDAVRRLVSDSPFQIGGQPAAYSPFRTVQLFVDPTPVGGTDPLDSQVNLRSLVLSNDAYSFAGAPAMASGLVDILSGSLTGRYTGVRDIVTRAQADPATGDRTPYLPTALGSGGVVPLTNWQSRFGDEIDLGDIPEQNRALVAQHLWMLDALPHAGPPRSWFGADRELDLISRMRYDELTPSWREQLYALQRAGTNPAALEAATMRLADQEVLGASIFVPRCTEFIVEWSFGDRITDQMNPRFGELIWHGLPRYEDLDRDGIVDATGGTPEFVVLPYPRVPDPSDASGEGPLVGKTTAGHAHPQRLIHGLTPGLFAVDAGQGPGDLGVDYPGGIELISAFGYFDPTYEPTADIPSVDWPWPALLRVTISLAADNDPLNERTFQFVFEVPDNGTL